MPEQFDTTKLAAALLELGVTPEGLRQIRLAPQARGEEMLSELKTSAKSRYRKLAQILHPDKNGGDAEKTAHFSFLARVIQEVERMRWEPLAQPAPPPQHFQHIQVTQARYVYPQQPGRVEPRRAGSPQDRKAAAATVTFMRPR